MRPAAGNYRTQDAASVIVLKQLTEKGEFPRQLVPRLGELGVLGPTTPHYGAGLDYTSYGLICHELERGDSGLRSFVSVQGSLVMFGLVRVKRGGGP